MGDFDAENLKIPTQRHRRSLIGSKAKCVQVNWLQRIKGRLWLSAFRISLEPSRLVLNCVSTQEWKARLVDEGKARFWESTCSILKACFNYETTCQIFRILFLCRDFRQTVWRWAATQSRVDAFIRLGTDAMTKYTMQCSELRCSTFRGLSGRNRQGG